MIKFKIIRDYRKVDETFMHDRISLEQEVSFDENTFTIDTKDLGDLIEALQKKQKEIEG